MATYAPGVVPGLRAPRRTAPPVTVEAVAEDINVVVEVPAEVSAWFGGRGSIPVLGLLDGTGIRGTLVPVGRGRHKLFLNAEMSDATGIGPGSTATLRLWLDPDDREPAVPDDLRAALAAAGELERFQAQPPSHRLEHIRWLEQAKRPDTRARRVARIVEATAAGHVATRPPT